MIINWITKDLFLLINSHYEIYIFKGNSANSVNHCLTIRIGNSVINKEFFRLMDLRSFALKILHLYGFNSLTYDIFLHPEDYME